MSLCQSLRSNTGNRPKFLPGSVSSQRSRCMNSGIPFSDPAQTVRSLEASAQRALAAGSTTAKCLGIIKAFRAKHPDIPVSLMLCRPRDSARRRRLLCGRRDAGVDAVLILTFRFPMRRSRNLNGTLPPSARHSSDCHRTAQRYSDLCSKKSLSALRDMFISSPAEHYWYG